MSLFTMYGLTLSIGTTQASSGGEWTYAKICGINNVAEALNEVVQQYFFLCQEGFATNHVTGMAPAFTLTGRRIFGDAGQDYIFSKKYGLGTNRKSSVKIEYSDGTGNTTITCDCTISNVQEFSGETTDDSAISFELRLDGKPKVTTA